MFAISVNQGRDNFYYNKYVHILIKNKIEAHLYLTEIHHSSIFTQNSPEQFTAALAWLLHYPGRQARWWDNKLKDVVLN